LELGTKFLEAEVRDRVMRVRINRPERRNAITQDMYRGLKRAAVLADADTELDALLLTGTDDVFAVGGDMSGQAEDPAGLAQEIDPTDHFPFRHLERCRKIVVCAVNGLCYAGGLNLLLFSDLSVASDRARFRAPELLRGVPEVWMAARLADFVGLAAAKYLLFTAEAFGAEEARRLGLIGKVVPHEALNEAADSILAAVRSTGPRARAWVKDEMNRRLVQPDVGAFKRALLSPEMVEGMKAFLEKRAPIWPRD
jgi:enoyl-CoA hydratase/carnithine racemase